MERIIEGQITIEQYLESLGARQISSERYASGQIVYLVEKCDISKYEVYGFYQVEDVESLILIAREGAEEPFKCIACEKIDDCIFETKNAAEEQVLKALESCECILASDMNILDFKAYTSKSDKGELITAFFAVLDNGYIYMKGYYGCGRLLSCSVQEAESMLRSEVERNVADSSASTLVPKLKNMYKTDPNIFGSWKYAERKCVAV